MSGQDGTSPFDPTVPGCFLRPDYFEVLARLRAEAPVQQVAPGLFTVARHEDVRSISRDPARFCSSRGALVNDPLRDGRPGATEGSVLHMDPPRHAEYRKLVNREFTPRAVARLEPRVRSLAAAVLDAVPREAPLDFVTDLAAPFPVLVIAELLGIADGDREDFRRWSDATIEAADGASPETLAVVGELWSFLDAHVRARQAEPADDLASLLAHGEVDGRRLRRQEVLVFCLSLLIAGNETTRHLISGGVHALHEHPDQREVLAADPTRIPEAVEELLRWVTPIQAMARTATVDTDVAGQPVSEGDYLVMLYASANRDEAAFGLTADRFDITRPANPPHLAFGFGEHLCLGAALARLEARVFFEELLARFPEYVVQGEPTWVRSTLVRGLATLPVVLKA